MQDSSSTLGGHVRDMLSAEDLEYCDRYFGFPDCMISRIVPKPEPDSLVVVAEDYNEWTARAEDFKGAKPQALSALELVDSQTARLDGIDMRQTAPLTEGMGLLRPGGLEWRKCEEMLNKPLAGKPPVMIARAGGLDQGNIIQNLLDVENHGDLGNYLFLAGSAINSIKNDQGVSDPAIGAQAMQQALMLYTNKVFPSGESFTVQDIKSHAQTNGHKELAIALAQRYQL